MGSANSCALAEAFLRIASLENDKTIWLEVREEVWCLKWKGEGHDKDHCLVFMNYVVAGGLMTLRLEAQARPSMGLTLCCAICQVEGKHVTKNFHLPQKSVQTP